MATQAISGWPDFCGTSRLRRGHVMALSISERSGLSTGAPGKRRSLYERDLGLAVVAAFLFLRPD